MSSYSHPKPFLSLAHWLAIGLLVLSIWSGIHLGLDNRPWLHALLPWWPGMRAVPFWHLQAALGWLMLLVLWLLLRRRQVVEANHSQTGTAQMRLQRHGHIVRLLRYVLCAILLSGCLLYLWPSGFGSTTLRNLHLFLLALLVPLLLWHLLIEWQIGAWPRVRHLFLRTLFRKPGSGLRVVAGMLVCALALAWALDQWQAGQRVLVPKMNAEMQIDGLKNETTWQQGTSITIHTYYGAPYERNVPVEISLLHDGYTLYLHARWPDPSRSYGHLPLVKTAKGWQVRQTGLLAADEQVHYEDKFAVMLGDEPWAALKSVFLGAPQVGAAPAPARGGHLMPKGEMVDVWHWKSVRNHGFGNLDDAFFGDGLPYLPGQRRYTWGYASDPLLAGGYKENWVWFDENHVTPLRLPRKNDALAAFQGKADGKGNDKINRTVNDKVNDKVNGKGNGMTSIAPHAPVLALDWHDSQPYSKVLDTFAPGTILPSVVWVHPNEGDRADVRANAVWQNGYWHLEMARGFETGSRFDKKIRTGSFLWFATFDHAQTRHTWHLRPLRLELQP